MNPKQNNAPTPVESWRANLRGDLDDALRGPRPSWWWTGLPPQQCTGLTADGTLSSLPLPNLQSCTRASVREYFDNTWTLTELLFSALNAEVSFYCPPYHQLRHPMVFYYCHPAALYINKLRVAGLIEAPLNPHFEQLFETGVDEMRWDDMSKNEMLWPSLREVHAYRKAVYGIVRDIIESHRDLADGHAPIGMDHPLWTLFMGFEHERIHLETSSVLIRELPLDLLQRPAEWPALHPSANRSKTTPFPPRSGIDYPPQELIQVNAAKVTLGKPVDWPSFGWDNEYGRRELSLQSFRAGKRLISNGEYYEFVRAGGYREEKYWSEAGWSWRTFRNSKWPCFWVPDGPAGLHRYRLRTLFETIEMPWDWPAEVNGHEARAYCVWKSERGDKPYRLPSEAEYNALRDPLGSVVDDPVMNADDVALMHSPACNLNLAHGSSSPVDAGQATRSGFQDVQGNVWQWIEDHFNPLPGAEVHPYYDDFSSPCYDGQHQMILGGSWVSTGDEASVWSRFHFRSHFYQHAGFRLVQAAHDGGAVRLDTADSASQVYEDQEILNEYLLLHYGGPAEQMPWDFGPPGATGFPQRCAQWLLNGANTFGVDTALDVGCAVGGASFELARGFREVIGVDLSRSFIDTANRLQRDGELRYFRKDEGELGDERVALVDPAIQRSRVGFRQADAASLPADWLDFDAVLLANLLCRLPSPRSLLSRLGGPRGLVKIGGLVAIFSPYTWLEQFTPRGAWLGGTVRGGKPIQSADALHELLNEKGFVLRREEQVPLVIREHARKFQYIVTHGMLWQRVR